MQRLKQHNLGAQLRLLDEDFLIAQGPVFPFSGALRRERFHIESGGYGEHDYHELAAESAIFDHHSIRLSAEAISNLKTALQAAQLQCRSEVDALDPNGTFRTIQYRVGDTVMFLCAEYVNERATPDVPAFEAAWELLRSCFARLTV